MWYWIAGIALVVIIIALGFLASYNPDGTKGD